MEKEIVGLPTGFKALDEKLGGLRKGEVVVIASRPSVGKTSLAMNVAECLSLGHDINGIPFVGKSEGRHAVLYFSLEMLSASFAKRMLCSRAHINAWQLERDVIDEAESAAVKVAVADAANEMGQARLYVEDTANLDIEELCKKAKSMKRDNGIELVVVDYLQLCNSKIASEGGRKSELSHVFAHLKLMAKELMVPVVVLVQSFKQIDRDKLPTLSDLRDVAVIEENADIVMFLRRIPPYYDSEIKASEEDVAILDIAKNRKGETGEVKMTFSREFMRFGNAIEGREG